MERAGRLSAFVFLPVAAGCLPVVNASADELGVGSLIHPTSPPQPIFRSIPKPVVKLDKPPVASGQFLLQKSARISRDGKPLWMLEVEGTSLHDVLKRLIKETNKQIVVSAEVPDTMISMRFSDSTLPKIIKSLCQDNHLTFRRIKKDIYLIVPLEPAPAEFATPELPHDIPPLVPPGWRGFDFNGKTYFLIPLQAKDATDNGSGMTVPSKPSNLAEGIDQLESEQLSKQLPPEGNNTTISPSR